MANKEVKFHKSFKDREMLEPKVGDCYRIVDNAKWWAEIVSVNAKKKTFEAQLCDKTGKHWLSVYWFNGVRVDCQMNKDDSERFKHPYVKCDTSGKPLTKKPKKAIIKEVKKKNDIWTL